MKVGIAFEVLNQGFVKQPGSVKFDDAAAWFKRDDSGETLLTLTENRYRQELIFLIVDNFPDGVDQNAAQTGLPAE